MSITARGDQAAFMARLQQDFTTPAAPGTGLWRQLPFYSLAMAPTEDVSEDDAIVGDAFPGAAVPGLRNMTGDIEVPMGMQSIGWHLRAFLGAPETTGSGPNYTHVFRMAALPVPPLLSTAISHRGIGQHFRQHPVAYRSFSVNARKTGDRQRATFGLLGSVEDKLGATVDAEPVQYTGDVVPIGYQGGVYMGDNQVAGVTGVEIVASSSMEPDQEEMNLLPTAAAFLDGKWGVEGSLSARFMNTTWYDMGTAGTEVDLELRFAIDEHTSLALRVHNARFERTGVPVPSGDIITSTFRFRASRPAAGQSPLTATLKNQTPTYANPE